MTYDSTLNLIVNILYNDRMFQWILLGVSFALSVCLIPLITLFCKKFSLYDSVNARKIHSGSIPRLGGIGIVLPFVAVSIIYALLEKDVSMARVLPLVISGAIIFLFGIADDLLELKAIVKLLVQLTAVTIVVTGGYRFNQIGIWKLPVWFSYVLTFGWILGITNAYNLIDGLDGLCGGLSFITLVTLGLSLIFLNDSTGILCLYLAASVLGFLIFNWPPASIFMGDCGSQFIGFMISVAPLYLTTESFEFNKFLIMLVLVCIPMMDTIAAIWRRLRDHRPIMSADRMHTHHKLMNMGLSSKEALYVMLALQILVCLCVGGAIYISGLKGTVTLIIVYLFTITLFSLLHYIHAAFCRRHNITEYFEGPGAKSSEEKTPADSE